MLRSLMRTSKACSRLMSSVVGCIMCNWCCNSCIWLSLTFWSFFIWLNAFLYAKTTLLTSLGGPITPVALRYSVTFVSAFSVFSMNPSLGASGWKPLSSSLSSGSTLATALFSASSPAAAFGLCASAAAAAAAVVAVAVGRSARVGALLLCTNLCSSAAAAAAVAVPAVEAAALPARTAPSLLDRLPFAWPAGGGVAQAWLLAMMLLLLLLLGRNTAADWLCLSPPPSDTLPSWSSPLLAAADGATTDTVPVAWSVSSLAAGTPSASNALSTSSCSCCVDWMLLIWSWRCLRKFSLSRDLWFFILSTILARCCSILRM
mmetsp:Transcript_33635/g.66165  ORF Transcript_33635/g.66165 Transcript_33635/m.66165 type:complete len:318 (+) Transcript_33635:829-1782(+)